MMALSLLCSISFQTLQDLLGLVGHYSGKTRAEALADLAHLIDDFPEELHKQV